MNTSQSNLEDRTSPAHLQLRSLERRLRRQARGLALLAIAFAAFFVLGAGPEGFQEIKARRFIVTDEHDNPRGLLTSHHGATVLSLFDDAGGTRVRLSVAEDGHPELTLLAQDGTELVQLAEREGAVRLSMTDNRGHGSVVIGQTETQFGVDIVASDSEHGLSLRADPALPQVSTISSNGLNVLQLFSRDDKSGLSISKANGEPGVILAVLEQLRPLLILQSEDRRTLVTPTDAISVAPASATSAESSATRSR